MLKFKTLLLLGASANASLIFIALLILPVIGISDWWSLMLIPINASVFGLYYRRRKKNQSMPYPRLLPSTWDSQMCNPDFDPDELIR
ncbi:MAG: hypothetical protein WCT08_02430 [Patescibacteria group bacterium]|jgi:hypothetical protein